MCLWPPAKSGQDTITHSRHLCQVWPRYRHAHCHRPCLPTPAPTTAQLGNRKQPPRVLQGGADHTPGTGGTISPNHIQQRMGYPQNLHTDLGLKLRGMPGDPPTHRTHSDLMEAAEWVSTGPGQQVPPACSSHSAMRPSVTAGAQKPTELQIQQHASQHSETQKPHWGVASSPSTCSTGIPHGHQLESWPLQRRSSPLLVP